MDQAPATCSSESGEGMTDRQTPKPVVSTRLAIDRTGVAFDWPMMSWIRNRVPADNGPSTKLSFKAMPPNQWRSGWPSDTNSRVFLRPTESSMMKGRS
jgi:hypothetical protein